MGGFFGTVSKQDAISDVFFGTDYHSHLGTRRAGMAAYDKALGLQRVIHNIENTPFRTKFDKIFKELSGMAAIGCISDYDPQPLLICSHLGTFAICMIGRINNADELIAKRLEDGNGHFAVQTGGHTNSAELFASLICRKQSLAEGIRYAQETIDGSASVLLLTERGTIIAARDTYGRLPVILGKNRDGHCVSSESFAYQKLDYETLRELGPAEIVEISAEGVTQLLPPKKELKICAFLWSYYGYPTSFYEGVNVETMRYRNGRIMAQHDKETGAAEGVDYIAGVPDSGTPHAIGFANEIGIPFARPLIKYTPTWARSFMPSQQNARSRIARMKQIPVHDLIVDKNLLFVDDSVVRGTQLKGTVNFLYTNGAKSVHIRSACPPIMYGCKYLNFSRNTSDMDLIARRMVDELEGDEGTKHLQEYSDYNTERGKALRCRLCEHLKCDSLEYQSLDGLIDAIGLPKCSLCTYCWDGEE